MQGENRFGLIHPKRHIADWVNYLSAECYDCTFEYTTEQQEMELAEAIRRDACGDWQA